MITRFRSLLLLVSVLASPGRPHVIDAQSAQPPAPPSTGVITGTVVDESGQPAVGMRVQAIGRLKRWNGPYYEVASGRPDETDDRGRFRLHSLPSGQYVVAVSMQSDQGRQVQRPAGSPPAVEYWRTYNPGTTSLADARPLVVAAGQEQSVSIGITPARFVSVSGVARTSDGTPASFLSVTLCGGPATVGYTGKYSGFMTASIAGSQTAPDGSFTILRVPPGDYTLVLTNGYTRRGQTLEIAEIPLAVRDVPLTGVDVTMARGATVSGRLEWGDPGPAPWPGSFTSLGRLRASGVGRESDFASIDTEVKPDGTFQFTNLYGLRRLQAMSLPFNWTIRSVEGPANLRVGQNLAIKPGSDIADLRVIVTNRVGQLWATVADENDAPFLTGSVLLMSPDPTELDPMGWGFNATQKNYGVNDVSYYLMERILPGRYLAVAIDVEPYRLSGDADLMERARAAARPVDIGEGRTHVDLRVVRLRPLVRPTGNQ